jgi:hypothetical protein
VAEWQTQRIQNPQTSPTSEPLRFAAVDAVDAALAHALTVAADAGRWELAVQLVEELKARRLSRGAP